MPNPAFHAAEQSGSESSLGSSSFDGSTSAGTGSGTSTNGSTDASGTASGTGTGSTAGVGSSQGESTGEPAPTSTTSNGESSDSGESGDTTGADCQEPCDGDGECIEGQQPLVINCVNGCLEEHFCAGDKLCVVIEGVATCAPPDGGACDQIKSAYAEVVENPANYECSDDAECHAVAGACVIPGGECWHVLNDSVGPEQLLGLGEVWTDELCEGECSCDGVEPPAVACQDNACSAQ